MGETNSARELNVLLAENRSDDSSLLRRMLSKIPSLSLQLTRIQDFLDAEDQHRDGTPDIILLDLSASPKRALKDFLSVFNAFPTVPIIILIEPGDETLEAKLAREGAQDCLVKSRLDVYSLHHSLRLAMARQRLLQQLRSFSLVDELTGLYNRRGFLTIADHQLKVANRAGHSLFLAFVDVDGLKVINDIFGHNRGDLAIIETAHILKEAFRETDIMARIGGDEFVALLVADKGLNAEALIDHFKKTIDEHNSYGDRSFKLSASIGITRYDPRSTSSVKDLLARADQMMYEEKRSSAHSQKTIYQLRFLKSVPITAWLRSIASVLEVIIPVEAWAVPTPSAQEKKRRLKNALSNGLITFLTRRHLCGTDSVCDLACTPAPENKNLDRFDACVILGHTRQYLVEGTLSLKEMGEKLADAVIRELPGALTAADKIQATLREAIAGHLYLNPNCQHVPFCRDSHLMNLKQELHRTESDGPWARHHR